MTIFLAIKIIFSTLFKSTHLYFQKYKRYRTLHSTTRVSPITPYEQFSSNAITLTVSCVVLLKQNDLNGGTDALGSRISAKQTGWNADNNNRERTNSIPCIASLLIKVTSDMPRSYLNQRLTINARLQFVLFVPRCLPNGTYMWMQDQVSLQSAVLPVVLR